MSHVKPTVLVIDDSAVTVRAVQVLLSRSGYDVHAAATGEDGLRAARELVPRVIVLDVDLPDIDGYTVCRRLRDDPRTAAVPVILCTARGEALDDADRAGVQAQAYLPKPFSPSGLRDLVVRFVNAGRTPADRD